MGVLDRRREVRGRLNGPFRVKDRLFAGCAFTAVNSGGDIVFRLFPGGGIFRGREIICAPENGATFSLSDVTIGIRFHWERNEEQTFEGSLRLLARNDGTIAAVNDIGLERYLESVISSEMNPEAPREFLKAHTVASRSWLLAALKNAAGAKKSDDLSRGKMDREGERIRWYGREDHDLYDVCADDHCQRYHGITRLIPGRSARAVDETRGLFLVQGDEICDARYHKACGGITEPFENVWEDRHLRAGPERLPRVRTIPCEVRHRQHVPELRYCHQDHS